MFINHLLFQPPRLSRALARLNSIYTSSSNVSFAGVFFIHLLNDTDEESTLVQDIWKRKMMGFTSSTSTVTKDILEMEKLIISDLIPENNIFRLTRVVSVLVSLKMITKVKENYKGNNQFQLTRITKMSKVETNSIRYS